MNRKHADAEDQARAIADLQRALEHARQLADAERRRADRAEHSAKRAWRLALWGGAQRMGQS